MDDRSHESERLSGDLIRFARVASVDLAEARCTVVVADPEDDEGAGQLTSGSVPWFCGRAGDALIWSPPSVGEQGLLLCPEGEIEGGLFLPGVYSDAHPAGETTRKTVLKFSDGAQLGYDPEAKALTITLPAGGKLHAVAPGGFAFDGDAAFTGDMAVSGKVTAQGDVVGQGVSLHGHKHGLVKSGSDSSGAPL